MRAASAAVAAAEGLEVLTALGFTAAQAEDALAECSGDVQAAAEWLLAIT